MPSSSFIAPYTPFRPFLVLTVSNAMSQASNSYGGRVKRVLCPNCGQGATHCSGTGSFEPVADLVLKQKHDALGDMDGLFVLLSTARECNRRRGRGNTNNSSSSGTNGLTPNTTGDGWEPGRNPILHFTSSSLQGAIGQRVTCLAQGLHEASRIFEKTRDRRKSGNRKPRPSQAAPPPFSPGVADSSAVAPSRFFPISPNSLVLPIAPAPCNHPPPPFPLLRPPLAAARLAAAPRRRRRRVRVAEIHHVHPSFVEVRHRSAIPIVRRSSRSPSAACRPPSVAPLRRSPPSHSVRTPSPFLSFPDSPCVAAARARRRLRSLPPSAAAAVASLLRRRLHRRMPLPATHSRARAIAASPGRPVGFDAEPSPAAASIAARPIGPRAIWAVGPVDRRWTTCVVPVHGEPPPPEPLTNSGSSDALVYFEIVAERCPSTPNFVHLHPCTFVYNQTEPQTKPYPLDMWKYGSALQQRPEDRSLYGRSATIKTMHPEPSLKPF
uniref:Uncharacterized protein n=1 Tax=Oryza sativa subsp. japonica TaxID=39947 RepID=Q65X42_ORYSJ|nr:hypothetical protein [Oryza sativa Japonica Group]AAU44006.1 hypothetical protein [Oryza sativa Japonica Group]